MASFMKGLMKRKGAAVGEASPAIQAGGEEVVTAPPRKQSRRRVRSRDEEKDATGTVAAPKRKKGGAARTADTDARVKALMKMTGGSTGVGDKLSVAHGTTGVRSESVHIGGSAMAAGGAHPKKRKSTGGSKEERRHSMFPADKKKKHGLYDRSKGGKPKKSDAIVGRKKVPYRIKHELFDVYDYYEPTRLIGSGAYAVVCEAKDKRNGKRVAIKKNKGVFDHITDARRILREIKLLMHFDQEDIIALLDVVAPSPHEFDTFNDVYIVMPKIETTLAKVIKMKQKLTEQHYQFFMYQMLRGLHYMHAGGVIHRDLKPENILISGKDCDLKITDFGLARGVSKDDALEKPTEYVVTRWYRSPEVMCSAGFYDEKVDVWSVGCILAEMILKRPLFPGQNYLDQLKIIFEVLGTPRDTDWIKTPEARKWVLKLKPHRGKNLTAIFEKATPNCLDVIKQMLELDPGVRPGCGELLAHPWFREVRRPSTEIKSPTFNISFEFEKSIKTRFGVRHMMSQCLVDYEHAALLREREVAVKKKRKKKQRSDGAGDSTGSDGPRKRKSSRTAARAKRDAIVEGGEEEEDAFA